MITLAVETSCDETSAAVLDDEKVLSNIISSQLFHTKYGGVVPEVASREHLKKIVEITDAALLKAGVTLNEIGLLCATSEPGLIGALLVGSNFTKSMAIALDRPFISVNHIQAHLYSNFLAGQRIEFPFLGLIVSGGHTLLILVEDFFRHKILGSTIDDAAGEAFDKTAKLMGIGYPGGKTIDENSRKGNKSFHKFPEANLKDNEFDFSFSGIKTSVMYYLKKIEFEKNRSDELVNNICASFQEAMVNSLFSKALKASAKFNVKIISVSGGVSANSGLREKFNTLEAKGYRIYFPPFEYSTDNAAMIGLTGFYKHKYVYNNKNNNFDSLKLNAKPRLDYENF